MQVLSVGYPRIPVDSGEASRAGEKVKFIASIIHSSPSLRFYCLNRRQGCSSARSTTFNRGPTDRL